MSAEHFSESSQKLCLKLSLLFSQTVGGQSPQASSPEGKQRLQANFSGVSQMDADWKEDDVLKIEIPKLFARFAHLQYYFEAEDSQMVAALALLNKLLA